FLSVLILLPPTCTLFPYTTLFRSWETRCVYWELQGAAVRRFHNPTNQKGYLPMRLGLTELLLIVIIALLALGPGVSRWLNRWSRDRKSTRLNSSHVSISYAVFCLK